MQSASDFIPNGLSSDKAILVAKEVGQDRWSEAEARTAELLSHVQPNITSEQHRYAVVSYLRCLIMNHIPCQVFMFGSVPLKTYLPDGDIDLTAFGENQNLKDCMIQEILNILQSEQKNENAAFQVKDVLYIEAEVKIIKCLVENFVVDISFNQLGGLGTLCFLEEVDNLIKRNHLLKRSIILIKAWCYYESRILGSHQGLLSTYALETLVLYIFDIYRSTFAGPLEVLFRFLDFFSKFDWNNYCINLRGPVPIGSLPNMRAEPPRKDCQELLFSEQFLNACKSCYGFMSGNQENRHKPFVSKFLNIVDPLRANNNLGRSISKGNFFRIKSAIALGAQRILRLLDCPEDNIIAEFDLFFKNTWDRNGNGYWIDAHSYNLYIKNNKAQISRNHEYEVEQAQASHESYGIYQKSANHLEESKQMFGTSDVSATSQTWSSKTNCIFTGTMTSSSHIGSTSSMKNALTHKGQSPTCSSNEVHDVDHFARFYPGPKFDHMHSEVPTQHLYTGKSERESGQIHSATSMIDNSSSSRSEVLDNHSIRISSENQQSFGHISYGWRSKNAVDSENTSNSYDYECGLGVDNANGLPLESFSDRNKGEITEPVDYNVLGAHSDHEKPSRAVHHGSSTGNSTWQTSPRSDMPKDNMVTTEQKRLSKDKDCDDPPEKRIINNDVNSRARSSYASALLSTSRTKRSSSSSSNASSSKTSQPDCESGDGICQSTRGTDLGKNTTTEGVISYVQALKLGRQRPAAVSNSSVPDDTNVLVGPGSRQRAVDNQSSLPASHGSSGPSSESSTIFPSNTETGNTSTATNGVDMDAELGKLYTPESGVTLDSTQHSDTGSSQRAVDNQSSLPASHGSSGPPSKSSTIFPSYTETGNTSTATNAELGKLYTPESGVTLDSTQHSYTVHADIISHDETLGYFVDQNFDTDILTGDFVSHWMNLQYGRSCQNSQSVEPLLNPPFTIVPMYLRGQFPWYRKPTGVVNTMAMAYGPPPIPVMPARRAAALHGDPDQYFGFWLPRFSDGTGTYLPNPLIYDQQFYWRKAHPKDQNEGYKHERRDNHGGREDLNLNSRGRFSSRGQFNSRFERKPGTNESPRQNESLHGAINKVAKFERDSKSSTNQPSSSKILGVQQDRYPDNKQ